MRSVTCIAAAVLIFAQVGHTRPVSYPGGWTLMQRNNDDFNSLHAHYSVSAYTSVGYRFEYWPDYGAYLHSAATNHLLKRWNMPDAQANIYAKWGLGVGHDQGGEDGIEPLAYGGGAIDWENRRFFTAYAARSMYTGDLVPAFHQMVHLGVAPYLGDYGDIHTWIMVKLGHHPGGKGDSLSVTPHLRFFRGRYMTEIGATIDGDLYFNWIIRF